ncbi:ATP-binding protein [Hymenobacter rubripertinctus]|uniref:ATP-binding protein n=1 Tax=Hymenobacter rubripertinctus TaxID=2029981 RepID=A0A418QXD5_9BACT|nr:AAA family ATPase [Hymenobacter rubripertinctus]RIY09818.1 ATP-binding protein [Hymenobacter rubripertinctus]
MSKLRVEHFGPITTGCAEDNGFMDFRKVTVLIGNQGTGKSSIAKLFSTCCWLEKALFQGRLTPKYVMGYNRFVKQYCAYQNLKNYFRPGTVVEYQGSAYHLTYRNEKLLVAPVAAASGYRVPQIMYVPAERNFLSAVDEPDKLKGLPQSLLTFWEELRRAQREAPDNLALAVGQVRFAYDKRRNIPRISGTTAGKVAFDLRLSEASSGFQSLVPLLLVLRHLTARHEHDDSRSALSAEERRKLTVRVNEILNNQQLTPEVRGVALAALSQRFRTETLLSIVEEPEQNLFPTSQRAMLYQLLEYANTNVGNELVLTTHSPYIVNYLTLAIKAQEVLQKATTQAAPTEALQQLHSIVPATAAVAAADTVVYELTEAGQIQRLATYHGLPSDDNYLNQQLEEANNLFADLLGLEATF